MKNRLVILVLFMILCANKILSQGIKDSLIKTSEYVDKDKRRDLFYDSEMKIIKEYYYGQNSGNIINALYYDNIGNIVKLQGFKKYPKLYFEIDFKKGEYSFPEEKIFLKFKNILKNIGREPNIFIFDGIQYGDNIVVNYSEGWKNGKLIQTEYGVIGRQEVNLKKGDPRYLQFDIHKFYSELGSENLFKLFNGVSLTFKDNILNGQQLGFHIDGNFKFNSVYKDGALVNYTSFTKDGNLISKIVSDDNLNTIITKPFILNGTLNNREKKKGNFGSQNLGSAGDIRFIDDYHWEGYPDYIILNFDPKDWSILHFIKEQYGIDSREELDYIDFYNHPKDTINLKKIFDDKKIMSETDNPDFLRILLHIPKYTFIKYDFEKNDQLDLIFNELFD